MAPAGNRDADSPPTVFRPGLASLNAQETGQAAGPSVLKTIDYPSLCRLKPLQHKMAIRNQLLTANAQAEKAHLPRIVVYWHQEKQRLMRLRSYKNPFHLSLLSNYFLKICLVFAFIVPRCKIRTSPILFPSATMKKQALMDLVRYHVEGNEPGFRTVAYAIADEFNHSGDQLLARCIYQQLAGDPGLVPQEMPQPSFSEAFRPIPTNSNGSSPLSLPNAITEDIMGIVRAISAHAPVNKFLLQGPPGTGKTETAKQIARMLSRQLYIIDFSALVDSHLGQTSKNIAGIFDELNRNPSPEQGVFLIDEIDSIALDRTNSRDVREMGRVTSAFLRALDELDSRVILIATTNLFLHFDKALSRRFDAVVDFNRYPQEDLVEIADQILAHYQTAFGHPVTKKTLFHKILKLHVPLPLPGDLHNLIKSSLLFSDPADPFGYLKRLYAVLSDGQKPSVDRMKSEGFTVREIEALTGVSKSTVSRTVKGAA